MAKLTIIFGILLVLVGVAGFVLTGSAHPTALIPSAAGLLFILFGTLANTDNSRKRMLWMHVAVTVALLLFLGTIPADIDAFRLSRGVEFPHPIAVLEKSGMSLLCLLFVTVCVRSFIAARRLRTTAT
jgi:hypothetical protein